jgi:hypothetical protein
VKKTAIVTIAFEDNGKVRSQVWRVEYEGKFNIVNSPAGDHIVSLDKVTFLTCLTDA